MARKPLPPQPIVTAALPRICPACASTDVAKIDTFGLWRCRCDRCGWTETYLVQA